MKTTEPSGPRRGRVLRNVIALAILGGIAALVTSAFRLGMATGLAAAGGVFVVYTIPAAIFDWPRLTLEDLFGVLRAIGAAIGAFFLSLFDW